MIKSLTIQNFQSHEKTYLEFDPGVNVIVGASDSGKTAIIRALRWVAWNRPSGDAICSHWGGKTSVEVETEDGCVVRTKDKIDSYMLNDHNAEFAFKAFGTSVPEEISKFLNLNEINLQRQLDQHFLLSQSPGAVAEHFNKVAKLEDIDISTQFINSEIRKLNFDINYMVDKLPVVKGELEKYNHLEQFEAEVEVLEEMDKEYDTIWHRRSKLGAIILELDGLREDIEIQSRVLILEEPLNRVSELMEDKYRKYLQTEGLEKLLDEITVIAHKIDCQQALLTLEKPLSNILALNVTKKTAVELRTSLSKLLATINNTTVLFKKSEVAYTVLHTKFETEFPEICPLCNKPK